MRNAFLMALGLWFAAGIAGAQQKLPLEDYLNQVRSQGPDYKAVQASEEGMEEQSHQMDLIYSPFLTASYNHLHDQAQQPILI